MIGHYQEGKDRASPAPVSGYREVINGHTAYGCELRFAMHGRCEGECAGCLCHGIAGPDWLRWLWHNSAKAVAIPDWEPVEDISVPDWFRGVWPKSWSLVRFYIEWREAL